jgi:hypothetical protein
MFGSGFECPISSRVSPVPKYFTVPALQSKIRFEYDVPLGPTRFVTIVGMVLEPALSSTKYRAFASDGIGKRYSAAWASDPTDSKKKKQALRMDVLIAK